MAPDLCLVIFVKSAEATGLGTDCTWNFDLFLGTKPATITVEALQSIVGWAAEFCGLHGSSLLAPLFSTYDGLMRSEWGSQNSNRVCADVTRL